MIHTFKIFEPHSKKLIHGVTDRSMGSFKEGNPDFLKNVEALGMGRPPRTVQAHSDVILEVDHLPDGLLPDSDGFITQSKDLLLMVKIADCQGVILYDPEHEAVGVVHSGWKGSVQNIIGKAVQKMKRQCQSDPKKLLVGISPSLGPCCAEFSDPKNELPAFCHPFILKNNHVDFWSLSQKQLVDEGVSQLNVEVAGVCTKCGSGYFSHRRGDGGRMGVFAKLI